MNSRTFRILDYGWFALGMIVMFTIGYYMGLNINLKKTCKEQVVSALLDSCEKKY